MRVRTALSHLGRNKRAHPGAVGCELHRPAYTDALGIESVSNEQVYAAGLLNRALDPATQPPEIRAFLQAEIDLLNDLVVDGMSVIDVGCGTGRHLARL